MAHQEPATRPAERTIRPARLGPLAAVATLGAVSALLLGLLGWNVWAMHRAYRELDERGLQLQRQISRVAFLDEALTLAATMAVLTRAPAWRQRYDDLERELVRDNLDIGGIAPKVGLRGNFVEVRRAQDSLIHMERRAMALAAAGRSADGSSLLTGTTYAVQKDRYVSLMRPVSRAFDAQMTALEASYRRRLVVVVVLSALTAVVLLVGFVFALRNVRRYLALERHNIERGMRHQAELEERVRERTAVLATTSEQLRQAQKMEAIGQLAGGVAHDFNNLLTAIQGHAELLLDELEPGHPGRPDVDEIRKASERAAALTSQLLAFGRRQMLKPQVVSLNDIVRSTDRMLRRVLGARIELVTVLDAGLPHCRVDPNQLVQVLVNLLVNARDAIGAGGGTITIETRTIGEEGPSGTTRCGLVVRDTGSGIAPELMSHIFEPFFTTKDVGKGTGLGLATVYGIVEQSGGEIRVESTEGAGTIFTIEFPACDAVVDGGEHAASGAGDDDPRDIVVLLVEDEPAVRHLITRTLSNHGYRVLVAQNGEEGRRVFAAHADEVDVVLTDIVMPLLSGQEMVRLLREVQPALPALYMSGYMATGQLEQASGPHTRFLAKPFAPSELLRALQGLLAAEGGAGAGADMAR
jgi:signal transduction histidine kinase/ActR/RegA family two-component response regulator